MAKNLDDYKAERKSLEYKISTQKSKNKSILKDVEVLEKAYDDLGKIKSENPSNADLVRDKTQLKKVAGDVAWRGWYKDMFDYDMKNSATPAAKDFYKSIDKIHDEIGKALDKKRKEYSTGIGIVDGLNRLLININGTIRNWTN